MQIKEIQVDGFGVWSGLKLESLPPGALVIYGPNEAGKTTLMQFVRAMLYGFSAERRGRYLPPVHGGRPGGLLRIGNGLVDLSLNRFSAPEDGPDHHGHLAVADAQGLPRDQAILGQLLAGVDEPTFNNVFACGLREIQELGTLDDTAAANHLYKLTTGLDRVSLIDVMRELEGSRERLLASDDRPAQLTQLLARRDQLRADAGRRGASTRRWSDLAAERAALGEEAGELEKSLENTDISTRLFEAALEVQDPWNLRCELERQLAALRDIKQLPPQSVEKLTALHRGAKRARRRLKQIAAKRKELRDDSDKLTVNRLILNQSHRIESIGEQAQWITSLETQIQKLRDELRRLEAEMQGQSTGAVAGGKNNLEEISADAYAVLRRPATQLREAIDQCDKAKLEADAAQSDFEHLGGKLTATARNTPLVGLHENLQETGQQVALLRRRLQVEERLDQLARRRQELEFDDHELHEYHDMPLRWTVALGISFSVGVMLVLLGWVAYANNWNMNYGPYLLFGFLFAGGSFLAKFFREQKTEDTLTDARRQLEQLRTQLTTAKQERDEIDARLPPGSGPLDARLREAEAQLRELERLAPLTTEQSTAEQRHDLSQRRYATAQETLKEARGRWRAALRGVGLPEDFPPHKIKHVVRSTDNLQELRRRLELRRDELDQKERELLVLTSRISQLVGDVRLTPADDHPQVQLRQLTQALAQERDTLELRAGTLKKAKQLGRLRGRCKARIRQAIRRRSALFQLAGVADLAAFRQVASQAAKAGDLQRQRDELTKKIQTSLAGQFTEEQIAAVFAREGRDLQSRWDQRLAHVQEIRARLASLHERRGACTHEMQQLAADRSQCGAQLELGVVEEQLQQAVRRWQTLAVLGRTLESIRKSYETDRQPQTLLNASQHLSRLTLEQYRRVWLPLDRRVLLVEDQKGESLPLNVLSRGTREAVYISLRLALATSFADRGARLPLVLDDVLVNLDARRVRAAADVLRDFGQSGHQVLLFTCHEHVTRIFADAGVEIRTLPTRGQPQIETIVAREPLPAPQPLPAPEPIAPPPPAKEPERPKRRRRQAEDLAALKRFEPIELPQVKPPAPMVELPPPPPPQVVPDEPPPVRRAPRVDPNLIFSQAYQEDGWYDVVNLFEIPRPALIVAPVVTVKPPLPVSEYQIVSHYSLPDYWPLAETPRPRLPAPPPPAIEPAVAIPPPAYQVISFRYLPDTWPLAPIPQPAPAPVPVAAPVARIDPPQVIVKPPRLVRQRRQRFTWESPEMYWEDHEPEVVETVVTVPATAETPATVSAVSPWRASAEPLSPFSVAPVAIPRPRLPAHSDSGETWGWQ